MVTAKRRHFPTFPDVWDSGDSPGDAEMSVEGTISNAERTSAMTLALIICCKLQALTMLLIPMEISCKGRFPETWNGLGVENTNFIINEHITFDTHINFQVMLSSCRSFGLESKSLESKGSRGFVLGAVLATRHGSN